MRIVFLVVTLGNDNVKKSARKVCESFMGTNVEVPHHDNIPKMIRDFNERIEETSNMIVDSQLQFKNYLKSVNYGNADNDEIANLEAFSWLCAKEKAILTAINMMRPR